MEPLQAGLVVVLAAAMVLAAVIDYLKLKVPNWLTFPVIILGWGLGALGVGSESPGSLSTDYLWASFMLTLFGLVLLLPVYAIGGVGAGDVKMQMGFGAWAGAIFGLKDGFQVVLWGFCIGAVVGGVLAVGMMVWRGTVRENLQNTREILHDWMTANSVKEVATKAAERKPRLQLLPYGVPLCIGYLVILVTQWMEVLP